ncbi:MAG TPA: peptide chain release factor N(5)-glutamine methyltransferase [bacterium]|nr:peptide chain release factor N(5)-glutamine methyltransferase [bacterium]
MEWTLKKLLDWATEYFQKRGIDSPRLNAELLLGRALDLNRVALYVQFDRPMNEAELAAFKSLVQRRAAREPLAYILGEREFYSLKFKVGPAVLIPRPETEELVERGLGFLRGLATENPRTLDIATGSGCIPIALLKNHPGLSAVAFDASAEALALAASNAAALGVDPRLSLQLLDFHGPWPAWAKGPFDLITANPPYVAEAEWLGLEPEVREAEPKTALVPGPSGLEAYEVLLPQIPARLKSPGLALFEIGAGQGPSLLGLAARLCPELRAEIQPDLAGRDRFLALQRDLPNQPA